MYFFLGIVPYDIIMKALAYQADPQSVDPVVKTNPPKEVRKKLIFYHYWIGTWYVIGSFYFSSMEDMENTPDKCQFKVHWIRMVQISLYLPQLRQRVYQFKIKTLPDVLQWVAFQTNFIPEKYKLETPDPIDERIKKNIFEPLANCRNTVAVTCLKEM